MYKCCVDRNWKIQLSNTNIQCFASIYLPSPCLCMCILSGWFIIYFVKNLKILMRCKKLPYLKPRLTMSLLFIWKISYVSCTDTFVLAYPKRTCLSEYSPASCIFTNTLIVACSPFFLSKSRRSLLKKNLNVLNNFFICCVQLYLMWINWQPFCNNFCPKLCIKFDLQKLNLLYSVLAVLRTVWSWLYFWVAVRVTETIFNDKVKTIYFPQIFIMITICLLSEVVIYHIWFRA